MAGMSAIAWELRVADRSAIPPRLLYACFALFMLNLVFVPALYFSHWWILDAQGHGIPTDFVNVWSAGKLALDGRPAQAWDWDIQKQLQIAVLGQSYVGNFAWHYPPPFLFIAAFLAQFPYAVAFAGWVFASLVPYLVTMRALVGRPFGLVLGVAFPVFLANVVVGQNGFLTAALIGGTLYLLPNRPVLSGICLGLLTYKPQYGLLFPLVLIATAQWTAFASAGITAVLLAALSWLAFGTESWLAFFHWMPKFSQTFLTEGKAPWWKLQSIFSMVRYFGGSEPLGWAFQWVLTASVAVVLALMWRSRVTYTLKAAALAAGTLLTTPYLFMYDMMVLAIPIAFLVRIGLKSGFRTYELPVLGAVAALGVCYMFTGIPTGLGATLVVSTLILRRAGPWWRHEPAPRLVTAGA